MVPLKTMEGNGFCSALRSATIGVCRVSKRSAAKPLPVVRTSILALALFISNLSAQGSPYVPLDDISYHYINALISRGALTQLSALERPYTVKAIRQSLDSSRARGLTKIQSEYAIELEAAIGKYDLFAPGKFSDTSGFHALVALSAGTIAQTSGRRELMLPDTELDAEAIGAVRLQGGYGPVVGVSRIVLNTALNDDPDFSGRRDRMIAGRTEDAYISAQWKYAELFFGRQGRNWGPYPVHGLQLGNYAFSYDHIYGALGPRVLRLSTLLARLDNYQIAPGTESNRYLAIHRLASRWKALELAISEAYLYTGVGRTFEPTLANPFSVYSLAWRNERQPGNLNLGAEAALHTRRFGLWSAHLLLDDFQIDRCDPQCAEPFSYGVTFAAEGLPLFILESDQRWFFSYTRLSNLAYRTPEPSETYTTYNVGLGHGFSDYDETRLGLDLALIPYVPLKAYAAYRRQGEGDYRAPFPTPAQYSSTPGFLSGVVMKTARLGLSGAGRLWPGIEANGDIGINIYRNHAHTLGDNPTHFEGRVRINIEPQWAMRRLVLH